MTTRPEGRFDPLWIAGLTTLLYALTYHGRDYHDSAFYAEMMDLGAWFYVHLAFMPVAQTTALILRQFGEFDAYEVLAVVAVWTGGLAIGLVAAVLRALDFARGTVIWSSLLVALAPAVWFGGVHPELHLFSSISVSLACLLTIRARGPNALICFYAGSLAVSGHMSAAFTVGGIGALRAGLYSGGTAYQWCRTLTVSAIGAGLGALTVRRLLAVWLPENVSSDTALESARIGFSSITVAGPFDESFLWIDVLAAFGVVGAAPLCALVSGGPWSKRLPIWCGLLPVSLFALILIRLDGQYMLVGLAFFGLATAACLSRLARQRVFLGCLVAAQLAIGVAGYQRLAEDPDRAWAESIESAHPGAVVLCAGGLREAAVRRYTDLKPLDLQDFSASPVPVVVGAARQEIQRWFAADLVVIADHKLFLEYPEGNFFRLFCEQMRPLWKLKQLPDQKGWLVTEIR